MNLCARNIQGNKNVFSVIFLTTLALLIGYFTFGTSVAEAYKSPGKPSGFINDFANIISPAIRGDLENQLRAFEASTTNEIAVVTIGSLDGDTIENYAVKLFEEWKIGKEKKDNGVLLLIALSDRKIKIETGYGLEPYITDAIANRIINNRIAPAFKLSDYDTGISNAVLDLMKASSGAYEYLPNDNERSRIAGTVSVNAINNFLNNYGGFLIFVLVILVNFMMLTKSWWLGGVVGAGAGAFIWYFTSITVGIIAVIILGLFGLGFDYLVSKNADKFKKGGGRGGGFFFGGGGFGGSSGGFGGFGGGRSGGGGSSGGW